VPRATTAKAITGRTMIDERWVVFKETKDVK